MRIHVCRVAGDGRNETGGCARACVNLVTILKQKKGGENKKRKREKERGRRAVLSSRGGCNFQELTYLTTVNLGTLHTMHILCSFYVADKNFFHRARGYYVD